MKLPSLPPNALGRRCFFPPVRSWAAFFITVSRSSPTPPAPRARRRSTLGGNSVGGGECNSLTRLVGLNGIRGRHFSSGASVERRRNCPTVFGERMRRSEACGSALRPSPKLRGAPVVGLLSQVLIIERRRDLIAFLRFGEIGVGHESVIQTVEDHDLRIHTQLDQVPIAVQGSAHGEVSRGREEDRRRELGKKVLVQGWAYDKLIHVDTGIVVPASAGGGHGGAPALSLSGRGIRHRQSAEELRVARTRGAQSSTVDAKHARRGLTVLDEHGGGLRNQRAARGASDHANVLRLIGLCVIIPNLQQVLAGSGELVLRTLAIENG